MGNQQPNKEKVLLDTNVLEKIEKGEIASRRQLYKFTGRSKKLLQWLNDNKVL